MSAETSTLPGTQPGSSTEPLLDFDVIDALAGIGPGEPLGVLRERRPDARAHAQASFEALLAPGDASHVSLAERAAVALFVARLHKEAAAVAFYGEFLRGIGVFKDGASIDGTRTEGVDTSGSAGVDLEPLIVAEADRATGEGPYGAFLAENAAESTKGPEYRVASVEAAYALGDRLSAALEHAHFLVLHPRDASRERLQLLLDAGWSTTGIVTLSQLLAFLTFQLRVARGLAVLRGENGVAIAPTGGLAGVGLTARAQSAAAAATARAAHARIVASASEQLPPAPRVVQPPRFTQQPLGWKPWLEPLPVAEFTERHYEALVERDRVHMPYFRLLARDPDALRARTLTDLDIFFNTDEGLPRSDREIAAAGASRFNGCVFCASVHSRAATEQGAPSEDVQRLLDEGVGARITPRWNALFDATVALTATPPRLGPTELAALRDAGLDDLEVLDAIQAGAFFNWANRLMLSLGEPSA